MNHPCIYHKANELQRHDAELFIKEYALKVDWRNDGTDALVDIGCASGDVLMDFIYTIMPAKFEKIVGLDVSPKMINYAQELYGSNEKCDFKVLDIATDKNLPKDLKGQFNHVTSFYCLHWVQNKRQALRNIFNLIKDEGGNCFLVFLAANPVYDVYRILSKSNKWSSYMKDVDKYIKPLNYTKGAEIEFATLLKEEGFSAIEVDVKNKFYTYESLEVFKENVKAINPFLERMPLSLHTSFLNDIIDTVNGLNLMRKHPSKESDFTIQCPYKLVVAYAKKSPIQESH